MFKSCVSCGELVNSDAPYCRHCGAVINSTAYNELKTRVRPSVIEQQTIPTEQIESPLQRSTVTTHFTPDGQTIPPEYGPEFNPHVFCWPAFFYPEFWYAEKGLRSTAIINFWLRLLTSIAGIMALILLIQAEGSGLDSSSKAEILSGIGIAMGLIWLAGVVGSTAYAGSCAFNAYRRYTILYNAQRECGNFDKARSDGIRLYWKLLYVPFVIYLVIFTIVLAMSPT